MVYPVLKVL